MRFLGFCQIAMTESDPLASCICALSYADGSSICDDHAFTSCWHLVQSSEKCLVLHFVDAGKQRIGSVLALDHLNKHRDRLKASLRDFKAASDSKVLVRGDDFESYGDFLQLLQQVKVFRCSTSLKCPYNLHHFAAYCLEEAASKIKAGKSVCWLIFFAVNCMSHVPFMRQFMRLLLSHAHLVEVTFRSMTWLPSNVKVLHVILKQQLMPITLQILIIPAEVAEVDDLDFEAILSGCLLVKVNPASFQAYPDIFKAEERILGSPSDWHALQDTLTSALQVCICLPITHW